MSYFFLVTDERVELRVPVPGDALDQGLCVSAAVRQETEAGVRWVCDSGEVYPTLEQAKRSLAGDQTYEFV